MTMGENGQRLAKVRIRHHRVPAIGDKFCSRAGQKGTIGIILDECDMPFASNGVRPDIIVNPHAFPSRMTIGHLVECLVGKACLLYGGTGDCTAFLNVGPKDKIFGELLTQQGYHSSGNEILYNGMNGRQLEAEIYFGPTYYLRLKHMVKDKINYRARGPRTVLTRQTVQGRSNNGGLRVGEMDRDAIISHGMAQFLTESMMVRGDEYYMAVCNKTGTIAIYNQSRNLFLSPMADGPIKFVGNLEGELNIVPISRFGRDFSILHVPYSFKLLLQELKTMNVQMRLITADNVDQLTSLQGGDNLKSYNIPGLPDAHATFANVAKITADSIQTANTKYTQDQDEQLNAKQEEAKEARERRGEDESSPTPPWSPSTPPHAAELGLLPPAEPPSAVPPPAVPPLAPSIPVPAVKISRTQTEMSEVTVPAGLQGGDTFEVSLPDGSRYQLTVPEGADTGDTLSFRVPISTPSPPPNPFVKPAPVNPFAKPSYDEPAATTGSIFMPPGMSEALKEEEKEEPSASPPGSPVFIPSPNYDEDSPDITHRLIMQHLRIMMRFHPSIKHRPRKWKMRERKNKVEA